MIRHLILRIEAGRWGGAAITHDGSRTGDDVAGGVFALQWLGLMIEIGVGKIVRPDGPVSVRLGKAQAGRLLVGVLHDAMPS